MRRPLVTAARIIQETSASTTLAIRHDSVIQLSVLVDLTNTAVISDVVALGYAIGLPQSL